jgi:RNA polymerase sigma factor (sigma-70 family)
MKNERKNIDVNLLIEAQKGDQKAFGTLFNYYHDSIFHYILKIVKNVDDAEDLTMVTFEKAFMNFHKYTPTAGFSSWLSTIARNTAFDFLLYNKRRPYNIDIEDLNLPSQFDTPEKDLINKQTGEILNKSISKLKKNYKDVIELRYINDYSYDDVCSKLNMSGTMARVNLFRAKNDLLKIVEKYNLLN